MSDKSKSAVTECFDTSEKAACYNPGANMKAAPDDRWITFSEYLAIAYSAVCEDIERMEDDENASLPPSTVLLHNLSQELKAFPEPHSVFELLGITWWMSGCTDTGLMQAAEDLWDGYEKVCSARRQTRDENHGEVLEQNFMKKERANVE